MKKALIIATLFFSSTSLFSQNSNGEFDEIGDFSTKQTVQITMGDGTHLATDIFLPITQDSMSIMIDLPLFGPTPVQIIPKGIQYLIYDSINGGLNENPYQLPILFSRTPYDKQGSSDYGNTVSMLGYSYAMQDMRGCNASEGAYFPMYSDGWNKNPYHPDMKHLLDITEFSDPRNSNKHEDGYESVKYIIDSITRKYDINADGTIDTFKTCNGSVGMFGASALANAQYTAAATHKINPDEPGLKSLFPIVGSADQYGVTQIQNGVYRYSIVNNWISGQLNSINDSDLNETDLSIDNNLHSFTDYGLNTIYEAIDICLGSMIDSSNNENLPGYYPNSPFRASMDVGYAPVNEFGEGDINGTYSRYSNIDVPIYHLTGWWDLFIDGQIDTYNKIVANINDEHGNKSMQKLIIGPWAHQTITSQTTGDLTYPENVTELMNMNLSDLENLEDTETNIFESEIYKWFRHTLNEKQGLNDPKFIIPQATEWQVLNSTYSVRIPSENYILPYHDFIAYLGGLQGLNDIQVEINVNGSIDTISYDIPAIENPLFNISEAPESGTNEYFENTENVRFYVPGPIDDEISENSQVGNYWFKTDSFPFTNNINYKDLFLHANGIIDSNPPVTDEGSLSFTHDPDNPVLTVGGGNMTINTPDGERRSQGQMNLAAPEVINLTMNHPGVINFTSEVIVDSLCIIGFPKAKLFASSSISDENETPTNTDFFVRILDVYPNGKEYFVVEGAVNARAREYVKSIYNGNENPNAEFSNIISDTCYEYDFNLLPIAYTFGHEHQIKILISSGNYPRYMSSANLPLNEGEFFRRNPNDGKNYTFNGLSLSPRICTNEIVFSPDMQSQISLPVYGDFAVSTPEITSNTDSNIDIFPNPTSDILTIRLNNSYYSDIKLFTTDGRCLIKTHSIGLTNIDISNFPSGIYILNICEQNKNHSYKIIKTDKN